MSVTICEVGPRDGLQNEARTLEPALRAELVDRLAATGLCWIEAASFVNPRLVPQMAGAEEVAEKISRRPGVTYAGLALNERGYERLAEAALDQANYAVPATDEFGLRNSNSTIADSTASALRVIDLARSGGRGVRITISVAFGCPFAGEVDSGRVLELARTFAEAGAEEIVFADTIGVGVPRQVTALAAGSHGLGARIGMHFHNTRNTGFANAYAALESGVEILDASVGGTGGCPFAPKATGNVATEDLVYLLEGEGISTGVDLEALIEVANWLEGVLGHRLSGQLHTAGPFAAVAG
jgi:isopropylmalate/homocitrate/citramalate synthase